MVQGGYGALFAVRVRSWLSITFVTPRPGEAVRSRVYKVDRSRDFVTGYKVCNQHYRSVAVQTDNGARNLAQCTILMVSRW